MPGVMYPDGTCRTLAREQYTAGHAEDLIEPPTGLAEMTPISGRRRRERI